MKHDVFSYLNYFSSISVVLPFSILLLRGRWAWRYNIGLCLYVANHFLTEVIMSTVAILKVRNMETKLGVDITEGLLLFLTYYIAFKEIRNKKIAFTTAILFLTGYLSIYFMWDKYLYVPSHVFAFQHLMMLIPLILYFGERIRLMDNENITDNPMFWITSGFLIFYSVSIFYFALFNELFFHYKEVFIKGWAIHSLALIIMNILLAKGLWLIPKDSKSF